MGAEATEQSLDEFSLAVPEPLTSPRIEPNSQKPLLYVRGKKLWVCGQRNAAHIFAIAAVEVMRSRVGACRGERTSLFCINNRMSYCCTNWAVFYWARVCLREDRWWTPPPLPLIYTITSPSVCFAEVFPIPEWTTPTHPHPVIPHIFPMPRADFQQKTVKTA